MTMTSKYLEDNLVIGNFKNFSTDTLRLLEVIEKGQEVVLNDIALSDPDQLSIAIFNYPLIKDDFYKEFAEAAKRISSAKYAYYKKSAIFKENFTKLCTETFNKHHQLNGTLSHLEQIKKVKSALKLVKYIGELYVADFFINCNIAHFLEILSKKFIESKISEDCLECLISIISDRFKNEVKLYKHNVHTAAISNIIAEYENEKFKVKRNYKDLELIEAVDKTIKTKSTKGSIKDCSKSETVRQTKKIFEMIISGNHQLSSCVQKAFEISAVFPDSFEKEILQQCFNFIKNSSESTDEIVKSKCMEVMKFIGMLYNNEILASDCIEVIINFLNKFKSSFTETLLILILKEISDKVLENDDEILKQVIPDSFRKLRNGSSSDKNFAIKKFKGKEEKEVTVGAEMSTCQPKRSPIPDLKTPDKKVQASQICSIFSNSPAIESIEIFKDLLNKLSPTNVAYILRKTSQIKFPIGEETVKEQAVLLVDHAVNKPAIIKPIVQLSIKLPETVIPHFSISLMKKHLRSIISTRIYGCSERESASYGQLIKELYGVNYYDKFDVIVLLDNFTENFHHDRTALTTLLKFIIEFKDILASKKLSKNMKQKLENISQKLSEKMNEEENLNIKESVENVIRILRCQSDSTAEDISRQNSELSQSSLPQFQFPSMHIPPPKMFIPPPFISTSSNSSASSSSVNDTQRNKNSIDELGKQQQQMTQTIENAKNYDHRQSGSPSSTSISLYDNNSIESDEFYETTSNAYCESPFNYLIKNEMDYESAYSSLMLEDIFSKEDKDFKIILKKQFSFDLKAMNKFVIVFIKRGMKCNNSGYMDLIDEIRDGLKDNEVQFLMFIDKLDGKLFEFVQNLYFSNGKVTRKRSLQLILMIGEFFNMGYMKNQTFISCLEKLLNDIGGELQVTLFFQLVKISMDKIIENGLINITKKFLDVLGKRLSTIFDEKCRNLIVWELLITMKVLIYRYKKFQQQCPVTNFKMLLYNVSDETFTSKLDNVKFHYVYKKVHVAEIVEFFLLASISSVKSSMYVKMAQELQEITAVDDVNFTFKNHMEFKLHDIIKNFLQDTSSDLKMVTLFTITSFVGDLFVGKVASIYLVLCILEMLLEKEIENKKVVDSIKVLLQKVGLGIDLESVLILDKFFLFFNQVIKYDQGYRKLSYKGLIELREKKWIRNEIERNSEVIEECFGKITNSNFMQISMLICENLSNSKKLTEIFVRLLWKFLLNNTESSLLYAKLSILIANYNREFKKVFMSFMEQRNAAFKIICENPKIPKDVSEKLACVIFCMAYLYAFDFCDDDDIVSWIPPQFTKHLSVEQCDRISSIIGDKANESQNNQFLRAFITLVEYNSRENLFAAIKNLKTNLNILKLNFK